MLAFINSYPNLGFPQAGGKRTAVEGSAPTHFLWWRREAWVMGEAAKDGRGRVGAGGRRRVQKPVEQLFLLGWRDLARDLRGCCSFQVPCRHFCTEWYQSRHGVSKTVYCGVHHQYIQAEAMVSEQKWLERKKPLRTSQCLEVLGTDSGIWMLVTLTSSSCSCYWFLVDTSALPFHPQWIWPRTNCKPGSQQLAALRSGAGG